MCIKAGSDELESVKNLMAMSLHAVIADALQVEIEDVEETSRLVQDLGMTPESAKALREEIADIFDGFDVDVRSTPTVGALLDRVVLNEFKEMAA